LFSAKAPRFNNYKFEARNPKQIQMTQLKKIFKRACGFCVLDFTRLRFSPIARLFRISIFGFRILVFSALDFFAAGCDPVVNIGGTFFPGWMVAILIGSALTVAIRYIFVFTRLEPHVGPLALIYTSLGLLLSVVSWLILYRS
jgi:YtcA family